MYTKKAIPACYRYLTPENRTNILYTLVYTASNAIGQKLSETEFHTLLCSAHLGSVEDPLPVISEKVTCFSISSKYKCGFICSLCPYSARYKNKMISEEEMLISYSLKNYTNFQHLKSAGLTATFFQSLFLLNEHPSGKVVPTLPLLRLSYHYIEHIAKPTLDFSNLPTEIAGALDRNNPGKLLPENIQMIRKVLTRLQKEYTGIKKADAERLLTECQNPSAALTSSLPEPIIPLSDLSPKITAETYLNGLLSDSKSKNSLEQKKILPPDSSKIYRLQPSAEEKKIDIPQNLADKETLYLPASFSVKEAEKVGYPFHILTDNAFVLHHFEAFLLYNPVFGLEIVTDADTGKNNLLFCASKQFYYACAEENKNMLDLLRTYFSKSKIRRQVCLEPYRLYAFAKKNNLPYHNIYSLRTAYKVLKTAQKKSYMKTPAAMVKELASRTNQYGFSPYIFAMPYYVKMYEVLEANPVFQKEPQQKDFLLHSGIDALLGISYELKELAETTSPLFTLDEQRDYQFTYQPDMKMRTGIYSITFHFSATGPLNGLVSNLLYRLTKQNLPEEFGYRLLRFSSDFFTLATTEENYPQLREIIVNLSTYLAEQQNLLPLIVKEEKHFP